LTWFGEGLSFQCTRCGNCCTGSGGYVWLPPRDEQAIAAHLGLAPDVFRKRYTRLVNDRLCLVDQPNGDCVFLTEERGCAIQPVKPRQCLTYPFWPRLTATAESWREVGQTCPGVGSGPCFTPGEIEAIQDRENPREVLCRILDSKRG
jgi:Fe-S-cluster containining protein